MDTESELVSDMLILSVANSKHKVSTKKEFELEHLEVKGLDKPV